MGNCISKINKDYFFEEEMKNHTSFFKKKAWSDLERGIRGKTYDVGPITNWAVVETPLKRVRCMMIHFCPL